MHVILTGARGVGKSTLCADLAARLRRAGRTVGGVWTETVVHGEERSLICHDLTNDDTILLAATTGIATGQHQGPFTFSDEGLFAAMRAIGNGMRSDLLIVDEIGPLEMRKAGFFPVLHVLRRAAASLLVVRPELIDQALVSLPLGRSYDVVEVAAENRAGLLADLLRRAAIDPDA